MSVIILEGPDGSGKTTLANHLVNCYGFKYEHEKQPKATWTSRDLFSHYVQTLYRAQRARQPVVLDRHYLGETIYGPVMRNRSLLTAGQVILIERLVRAGGTRVIVCLPPWGTVVANWQAKQCDYVTQPEKLRDIYERYLHEFTSSHDQLLESYDYTRGHEIMLSSRLKLPPGVIGSPTADVLLVGERVNTNLTSTDWAFFAETGSSGFLNQTIIRAGLTEDRIALVNAFPPHEHDSKNLVDIITHLPKLRHIIALGKTTARACENQGIKHTTLPHPSYVKRFNVGMDYYANQLREATQ
jgi:predicted ATPase